ncbi:hypothetical protein Nepgr_009695 [Nepenthes gracilis]|uniref:Uncharacterized protein n=1 Tax=Nepenthes gracilis TaxID=150966 RepID=A0AAD3SBN6_NEPGR|nr:hypothetical protein Nepgr_009695 [Nepenthes gracilis]
MPSGVEGFASCTRPPTAEDTGNSSTKVFSLPELVGHTRAINPHAPISTSAEVITSYGNDPSGHHGNVQPTIGERASNTQ